MGVTAISRVRWRNAQSKTLILLGGLPFRVEKDKPLPRLERPEMDSIQALAGVVACRFGHAALSIRMK